MHKVQVKRVGLNTKKSKKVDFDLLLDKPLDCDAKYTALLLYFGVFLFHIYLIHQIRDSKQVLATYDFIILHITMSPAL